MYKSEAKMPSDTLKECLKDCYQRRLLTAMLQGPDSNDIHQHQVS